MATGFDPAAFAAGAAAGSGLNNTVLGMINGGYGQIAGGDQADQSPGIGQRLLSGLQSHQEGYEQFSADAAKAKALRAVIKSYAADEPDPDKQKAIIDQTHTAGLGELEGIVQGHVAALTQQKQKADIAEQLARGDYYKSFGAARDQQVQDSQTTGKFLQNYLTAPKETDPDTGEETDMAPEDRLQYAAKNTPGLSGRHFPAILDSLANWNKLQESDPNNPDAGVKTTFDEDPVSGVRFASRGKQIMPSGTDPKMSPTQPVYSPDGKMLWNGKQWTELKQLGFPDGATIKTIDGVNAVVDAKGKILKTVGPARESALDQLKDFVGTNAPPSAATPSGWDQLKAYLHGGSNTNAAPAPTAPVNPANEVTRFSADGRAIVYDAKTKKPLRYAK